MTENSARETGRARRAGRSERARARMVADGRADAFVDYFKERIYATFTGLAIIVVVNATDHADISHALAALLLGVVGITAAGLVSDIVSHLAVHRELPPRSDVGVMLRVAGGGLSTVITPGIVLGLAWFEVIPVDVALAVALIVYIATLALIGWLAVRRSKLPWWEQLSALALLVALGLLVVLLQSLAHSA